MLTWITLPFAQLTTTQLYEMMKLRVDVFVVEQTC
ncbi:GNAT family N-acetyltransferase, partial [Vibrio parahaemolyticus]|nr:GNAT family N-acetyltransferase [Vibrio parahaemolyticus]